MDAVSRAAVVLGDRAGLIGGGRWSRATSAVGTAGQCPVVSCLELTSRVGIALKWRGSCGRDAGLRVEHPSLWRAGKLPEVPGVAEGVRAFLQPPVDGRPPARSLRI